MSLALFTTDGILFLMRWMHFLFGITWIGMLYYFNFVQTPFFGEADAGTKSGMVQKLVPRALWWFRWGAMGTFLTGWFIIGMKGHLGGFEVYTSSWGYFILTGGLIASLMWFNVWFVIWPNQQVVIKSALQVAGGGQAIAEAAAKGARAGVVSRTNTLFSIPMLFCMGAASHLPLDMSGGNGMIFVLLMTAIFAALQFNALRGKLGPLATVRGVIHMGVALTLAVYFLMEIFL